MSISLEENVQAFVKQFTVLLCEYPELRHTTHTLCASLLDMTEQAGVTRQESISNSVEDFPQSLEALAHEGVGNATVELQYTLQPDPGVNVPQEMKSLVYSSESPDLAAIQRIVPRIDDSQFLNEIKEAFLIKAQATRWAVERYQMSLQGNDYSEEILGRNREFFARANAMPKCFLWMLSGCDPSEDTLDEWPVLAECFECLMCVSEVLQTLLPTQEGEEEFLESALNLTAEALSALRVAVSQVGQAIDPSQKEFFAWFRYLTERLHIYVPQYMRHSDKADPRQSQNLVERLDALEASLDKHRQYWKSRRSLFSKARYHAQILANGGNNLSEWETLAKALDDLVLMGVQPSNRDIREIMLPIIGSLPDLTEALPNFDLVLRATSRYLGSTPNESRTSSQRETSREVLELRRLLSGKTMVIISGDPRSEAEQAIKDAFDLNELQWLSVEHHQSFEDLRPYIIREEVLLVCLLIRFTGHQFGEVKGICDANGKLFVRVPGGYSPNMLAHQILSQVGDALENELAHCDGAT